VFVLAATGTWYALACAQRRDWRHLARFLLVPAIWLLSFAASWLLTLDTLSQNGFMQTFWKEQFMPLPPKSASDLEWFVNSFFAVFDFPGGFLVKDLSFAALAALAFVVGAVWMYAARPWSLACLLLPIPFVLLASGLHKYPFGNRLILFLAPALVLVVAAGAERIRAATQRKFRFLGISFLSLLFAAPVLGSVGRLAEPTDLGQIKPLLDYVRAHRQPDDKIYVYTMAWPPYLHYAADFDLPQAAPAIRGGPARDLADYARELEQLRGRGRVWIVLLNPGRVAPFLRYHLSTMGDKSDGFEFSSRAAVYLYKMNR
jgi:hypothetical protein